MISKQAPDKKMVTELFKQYKQSRNLIIRDRLVEMHLYLVEFLARRFKNRGEALEDLIQVGTIGLIKAIDRFDLGREVEFTTYATPTIVGTLKRHFRDQKWAIRVPRRLQIVGEYRFYSWSCKSLGRYVASLLLLQATRI